MMSEESPPVSQNVNCDNSFTGRDQQTKYVFQNILDDETGLFKTIQVPVQPDFENRKTKRTSTRKRISNPRSWKRNIRKECHQHGKEYVSSRGKHVSAKTIKTNKDCMNSCKFKCSKMISPALRQAIHENYYKMNQNQKYAFILDTTEKASIKRKTSNSDRKKFSYYFYFNVKGNMLKVCKTFYLTTLAISQKTAYGVHSRKDELTRHATTDKRGKHKNHRKITEDRKDLVRKHIESFPTVDSHYCRSSSQKKYLDPLLSVKKMHELYLEYCSGITEPVKLTVYTKIFNEEYNFGFHVPKKDRCDRCEEWKVINNEGTTNEESKEKNEIHVAEKNAMRCERNKDRDGNELVLCFDLQNIITCPRAEVSCFFYHSKLSVYNLTAHFSGDKNIYCAIWNETFAGKSGCDVASGLIKILVTIFSKYPNIKKLILWSDSCVPQNRNSLMSFAILNFLKENNNIESIELKYSTPGHSAVQEVDAAHSCIDRTMSAAEFYSPISFLRLLKKVNLKKPYNVVEMQKNDIIDYSSCTKDLNYGIIPYTKVVALKFTQCYFTVFYKTSWRETEWSSASILKTLNRPRRHANQVRILRDIPKPKPVNKKKTLPAHKVKSIKAMLKWMPKEDVDYFNALLNSLE